jgi:hypothetical protein
LLAGSSRSRLEPRLDLSSFRKRSSWSGGIAARALVVAALMAGLMALVSAGGYHRPEPTRLAAPPPPQAAPAIVATEAADRGPGAGARPDRSVRVISLGEVDYTPVASIPRAPPPAAAAPFAPVERAPGLTGFKVTAGH